MTLGQETQVNKNAVDSVLQPSPSPAVTATPPSPLTQLPSSKASIATESLQQDLHRQRRDNKDLRKASIAKDRDIIAKDVEIAKLTEEVARLQLLDQAHRLHATDVEALQRELYNERKERVEDVYRERKAKKEERQKVLALREEVKVLKKELGNRQTIP